MLWSLHLVFCPVAVSSPLSMIAEEPLTMPAARATAVKALHRLGPPTLIILGVLWVLQSALAHTPGHGVIIRNLNYDAGTVKAGSTVTDTVRLTNLSSVPVEVDAQPSCGCTVATLPVDVLAPLHSEVINLSVDTDGMGKGVQQKGVFVKMHSGQQAWNQSATIRFVVR